MVTTASLDARPIAAPFLKWAGGKGQLLGEILPRLPKRIKTYYEPFMGGGAVFFALANEGRFKHAVLADANGELVEAYQVVRDHVDDLVEALRLHAAHGTDADYFYEVRARDVTSCGPVERAARLIFLNKTCFNGLYRVNRRGQFNVPFGRYARPRILNEALLRAASIALHDVDIRQGDFEQTTKLATAGDAVYFDPPYVPISDSSSFTSYHRSGFGPPEQERLLQVFEECGRRSVKALLSNSDCRITRALYARQDVVTVLASRAINSVGGKRGRINELLVVGRSGRRANLSTPADSALPAALAKRRLRRTG